MAIIIFIIIAYFLIKLLFGNKRKIKKRRPAFKKLYELDQIQSITEFEQKMIRGMFAENREIFVTAFVNNTHVLRVTATIGSKYKCRSSDNIYLWGEKATKIGAARIRQYHNHPDVFGRSFTSRIDKDGHRELKQCVEQWGIEFHSFLVYKSWFGGAKIKKYY